MPRCREERWGHLGHCKFDARVLQCLQESPRTGGVPECGSGLASQQCHRRQVASNVFPWAAMRIRSQPPTAGSRSACIP
jgi:hypothetical protein